MRRWKVIACLTLGAMYLLACDQQADRPPIELVNDAPTQGVWYLQAVGEQQPIAIDTTVRFEFGDDGTASYERTVVGSQEPQTHELVYNLTGEIISIDSNSEEPGVPRITGMIELSEDGKTLIISTHTNERWLLTRDAKPGGDVEAARDMKQVKAKADPMLARVQYLAYASSSYVEEHKAMPARWIDLVSTGLISPESLIESGKASDLPERYSRMTEAERAAWLDANSAFLLFGRFAGSGQSSSVVVSTLPENGKAMVVVGMANGAVHQKRAKDAAQLLQFQEGALPDRWPNSAWSREATVGLEPLSD